MMTTSPHRPAGSGCPKQCRGWYQAPWVELGVLQARGWGSNVAANAIGGVGEPPPPQDPPTGWILGHENQRP